MLDPVKLTEGCRRYSNAVLLTDNNTTFSGITNDSEEERFKTAYTRRALLSTMQNNVSMAIDITYLMERVAKLENDVKELEKQLENEKTFIFESSKAS